VFTTVMRFLRWTSAHRKAAETATPQFRPSGDPLLLPIAGSGVVCTTPFFRGCVDSSFRPKPPKERWAATSSEHEDRQPITERLKLFVLSTARQVSCFAVFQGGPCNRNQSKRREDANPFTLLTAEIGHIVADRS
jgi:hypothetical protein